MVFSHKLATMAETIETLRASIEKFGPMLPVYRWRGEIIDGRRRLEVCNELGRAVQFVDLYSEEHARIILWRTHPDRALQRWPQATAAQAARAFNCRVADAARFFPKAPQCRKGASRDGSRSLGVVGRPVQFNVRIDRATHAKIKETAHDGGLTINELTRAALFVLVTRSDVLRLVLRQALKSRQS